MAQLFTNNAASRLSKPLGSTANEVYLQAGEGDLFPTPSSPDFFLATLQNGNDIEIVRVTGRQNDILFIDRAQEGTTAKNFGSGSLIELRVTAGTLRRLINGVMHIREDLDLSKGYFPDTPMEGDAHQVVVGGEVDGRDYFAGDVVVYTSNGWAKFKNVFQVTSVNGEVGDVILDKGDIDLGNVIDKLQLVAAENLGDLPDLYKARDHLQVDVAGLALRYDMAFT